MASQVCEVCEGFVAWNSQHHCSMEVLSLILSSKHLNSKFGNEDLSLRLPARQKEVCKVGRELAGYGSIWWDIWIRVKVR